ncbi:MAG: type II secretion system F family protein [Candidatus Baltobacteraceae bacterium]|jgi:tight adherence protein C
MLGVPPIIIFIAVGASLSLALFVVSLVPSKSDITKRLEELEGLSWESGAGREQAFERLFNDKQRSNLQQQLQEAGWYRTTPAQMGVRIVAGCVAGFVISVGLMAAMQEVDMTFLGGAVILTGGGAYLPLSQLKAAVKKRKNLVDKALPDMLDMLASMVQAGLTFNAALAYGQDVVTGPLAEEVKASLSEMRLGRSRADALRSMAMRVRVEQLTTTVTAVVQAERLGSNLAHVLEELAAEVRNRRAQRAEELANMMPTKMAIPMALFMLPALFVMIFGGVAANYVGK